MAVSDCIRTCRHCGTQFQRTAKGQPVKFCGHQCREIGTGRRGRNPNTHQKGGQCAAAECGRVASVRGYCSTHYHRRRLGQDMHAPIAARGVRVDRACQGCGTVMRLTPGDSGKRTCSRKCLGLVLSRDRVARAHCPCCGGEFKLMANAKSSTGVQRYCSAACARKVLTEVGALRRIAERWVWIPSDHVLAETKALHRIARYVERPKTFRCACLDCGAPIIARRNGGLHKKKCAACLKQTRSRLRRIARAKRRRAIRINGGENIDPIKVFERDGWRCHMCKRKTPKGLRGSYAPRAPELDHIVPLSMGGTHTWGNVACSCRQCNQDKGARPLGQLLLGIAA